MRIFWAKKDCNIPVGRLGENEATAVFFDISDWIKDFGDGTVTLLAKRRGDEAAYPCAVDRDGPVVKWEVRSADVSVPGYGSAELIYTVGDTIAKSEIYTTVTGNALSGGGDPPEPWKDWVQRIIEASEQVAEDRRAVEETAEQVSQDAETVERDRETVEGVKREVVELKGDIERAAEQSLVAIERETSEALTSIGMGATGALTDIENAKTGAVNAVDESADSALRDIGAEKQNALDAIESKEDEAIQNVEGKGEEAVQAVTDEGSRQEQILRDTAEELKINIDPTLSQAGKAAEAKATGDALAKTNRSLSALWDLSEKKTYRFETDDSEAYEKTVLSGARLGTLQIIGGKTQKVNQKARSVSGSTRYGLTLRKIGENKAHISGTINGTGDLYLCTTDITPSGHKVYMRVYGIERKINSKLYVNRYAGGVQNNAFEHGSVFTLMSDSSEGDPIRLRCTANTEQTFDDDVTIVWVDLTEIGFGDVVNVEDARIKWLDSYFLEHSDYDAGSLITADVFGLTARGRNLLNTDDVVTGAYINITNGSVASVGGGAKTYFAKCKPNTSYYFSKVGGDRCTLASCSVVPAIGVNVSKAESKGDNTKSGVYVTSSDAKYIVWFVDRYDYSKSVDLMICEGDRALPYSPDWKEERQVPEAIRVLGMKSAGNVYDYTDIEPVTFKNMKSVDLGALNWNIIDGAFYSNITDMAEVSTGATILCSKYESGIVITSNSELLNAPDKMIIYKTNSRNGGNNLNIKDSQYSSVDSFKRAMRGVIIHYETTGGGEDYKAKLYHQRVGDVDLGNRTWYRGGASYPNGFVTYELSNDDKKLTPNRLVSLKYDFVGYAVSLDDVVAAGDKKYGFSSNGYMYVNDSSMNTENELKLSLQGTNLYYELAIERVLDVTDVLADFDPMFDTETGGTITFENEAQLPVPNSIKYAVKIEEVG